MRPWGRQEACLFRHNHLPKAHSPSVITVGEWTASWRDEDPEARQNIEERNPKGPPGGVNRVIKGAFWSDAEIEEECTEISQSWVPTDRSRQDHPGVGEAPEPSP